jgi:hypothetical protein
MQSVNSFFAGAGGRTLKRNRRLNRRFRPPCRKIKSLNRNFSWQPDDFPPVPETHACSKTSRLSSKDISAKSNLLKTVSGNPSIISDGISGGRANR